MPGDLIPFSVKLNQILIVKTEHILSAWNLLLSIFCIKLGLQALRYREIEKRFHLKKTSVNFFYLFVLNHALSLQD